MQNRGSSASRLPPLHRDTQYRRCLRRPYKAPGFSQHLVGVCWLLWCYTRVHKQNVLYVLSRHTVMAPYDHSTGDVRDTICPVFLRSFPYQSITINSSSRIVLDAWDVMYVSLRRRGNRQSQIGNLFVVALTMAVMENLTEIISRTVSVQLDRRRNITCRPHSP